jgi:hypothetical protein
MNVTVSGHFLMAANLRTFQAERYDLPFIIDRECSDTAIGSRPIRGAPKAGRSTTSTSRPASER